MTVTFQRGQSLVLATHNSGKLRELQELLAPFGLNALAAGELGVVEPEETGTSFAENAELKAVACARATGRPSLADDSGLEVEALSGAPGIYSARWAGEPRDFMIGMARVEAELKALSAINNEQRRAHFICMLCLAMPDGQVHFFEGRAEGHVVWPPRGKNGFGYDPMFVPIGYDLTFGEMEPAQKHALSHRTAAFAAFKAAVLHGS